LSIHSSRLTRKPNSSLRISLVVSDDVRVALNMDKTVQVPYADGIVTRQWNFTIQGANITIIVGCLWKCHEQLRSMGGRVTLGKE